MSDMYKQAILDELKHPQNQGELAEYDAAAAVTNSSCGDQIVVQVKLDTSQSKPTIQEVAWSGTGCAISMAAASMLSAEVQGMTPEQVAQLDHHFLEEMIGVEQISLGRVKCLGLSLRSLQTALDSYSSDSQK